MALSLESAVASVLLHFIDVPIGLLLIVEQSSLPKAFVAILCMIHFRPQSCKKVHSKRSVQQLK